jgi:hypothetical protein
VLDEPTVAMHEASRRAFLDTLRAVPILAFIALAWGAIGAANEGGMTSLGWLAAYAVALFGLAAWAYRRDSLCKFG